jgi:hypothetical protein
VLKQLLKFRLSGGARLACRKLLLELRFQRVDRDYVFRQFGEHKYAYDEEILLWTLRRAGFEKVSRRPFDPTIDMECRRHHTMYASGIKPAH